MVQATQSTATAEQVALAFAAAHVRTAMAVLASVAERTAARKARVSTMAGGR